MGSIILGRRHPLAYLILKLTESKPIDLDEKTLAEQIGPHMSGLAAFASFRSRW
ncbi:MAG: hypothetical protein U0992_04875 [Planctomycetaceae bacterium]